MSTSAGVLNTRPGNLEFDEQSGWYYDAEAGFYFDPVSGLWYDPNTELWWNAELGQWVDADDCEEEEVYDVGVDGLLDASVGRPGDVVVPRELGELPPEQSQVLAQFDPLLKKKPKKDVQKQASSPGSAKKTAADMMREKDKIAMEKRSSFSFTLDSTRNGRMFLHCGSRPVESGRGKGATGSRHVRL